MSLKNPYIEEEQTTQWPKEKVQKDKQRSTKHTHTYIMTHVLFYIFMTNVLCYITYDTCLTLQNVYIFIAYLLCYIVYDTCLMLYISDSYLLGFRSTHYSSITSQ